jgi:hypothetical protein
MEQQELNMRIAMSLLRQCAWVWEHCTKNANEGEFKLSEVLQGMSGSRRYDAKPGMVVLDVFSCEYWDVFNKQQPVEGLTFDRKEMRSTVKIESFSCSFFLWDVFSVTASFCKWNCPSMANKVRFWCKDGGRGAFLPGLPKAKATKPKTTKPKATTKPMPTVKPLSLSEQLRQALLARMAA